MLVLTRKTQQQIKIGPNITVTVLLVKGQAVRLGIEAPRDVCVLRAEIENRLPGAARSSETHEAELPAPSRAKPQPRRPKPRTDRRTRMDSPEQSSRCRAPGADRAPLLDYLKRTGPASFSVLAEASG